MSIFFVHLIVVILIAAVKSDPNGSNVMCTEDAHHNIVSVDLVDWGIAGKVDVKHMTHEIAVSLLHISAYT